MTPTTNTSKAREIAETIGCSVQTVMNKAKGLGIKFKGRSAAEHNTLLGVLNAVRPRHGRIPSSNLGGSILEGIRLDEEPHSK